MSPLAHETVPIVAAEHFVLATRDTGYRSVAAAVAELIDNSLQANARHIDVLIREVEDPDGRSVMLGVLDEGSGMSPTTLECALQFGGTKMAGYSPRVEPALMVTYRGRPVFTPTLPNGGVTSLQILNMLECFPPSIAVETPAYWHRVGEIMKLAWRDRLQYLGDPDFTDVQVDRLLDKSYAQETTDRLRRFPDSIGAPGSSPAMSSPPGTIHVSAADVDGNVVSATLSPGTPFGSCVAVPGTGVILGHGMCRLDPRPGRPNSVAPGKRPLNNLAPMIVSLPDREVALGTRGGRPIVNVCAQLAHRFVDGGWTASRVLAAPRLHASDREPLEFLEFAFTERVAQEILDGLAAMGHRVRRQHEEVEGAGAAHCVELLAGERTVRASGDTWAAGIAW